MGPIIWHFIIYPEIKQNSTIIILSSDNNLKVAVTLKYQTDITLRF